MVWNSRYVLNQASRPVWPHHRNEAVGDGNEAVGDVHFSRLMLMQMRLLLTSARTEISAQGQIILRML